MSHEITIGGLILSFEPLKYSFPNTPKLRDPILVTAKVKIPFSETSAERLCIPFSDLISFWNKLKKFLQREDDGIVSLMLEAQDKGCLYQRFMGESRKHTLISRFSGTGQAFRIVGECYRFNSREC